MFPADWQGVSSFQSLFSSTQHLRAPLPPAVGPSQLPTPPPSPSKETLPIKGKKTINQTQMTHTTRIADAYEKLRHHVHELEQREGITMASLLKSIAKCKDVDWKTLREEEK